MSRIIDDIILGDEASFASALVPGSENMTFEEMIAEAIKRCTEDALNLEAAVKAANKEQT
jgi:hypothetical protein